jgi:hypothetical protein
VACSKPDWWDCYLYQQPSRKLNDSCDKQAQVTRTWSIICSFPNFCSHFQPRTNQRKQICLPTDHMEVPLLVSLQHLQPPLLGCSVTAPAPARTSAKHKGQRLIPLLEQALNRPPFSVLIWLACIYVHTSQGQMASIFFLLNFDWHLQGIQWWWMNY